MIRSTSTVVRFALVGASVPSPKGSQPVGALGLLGAGGGVTSVKSGLVGATDVRLTAGLLMLEAAVFVCSAMAAECTCREGSRES